MVVLVSDINLSIVIYSNQEGVVKLPIYRPEGTKRKDMRTIILESRPEAIG
jgi:hypothetical protein